MDSLSKYKKKCPYFGYNLERNYAKFCFCSQLVKPGETWMTMRRNHLKSWPRKNKRNMNKLLANGEG